MSSVNIAVLLSGGGTNFQSIIDNVENGNINGSIKVVISNKKNAYGLIRGENHGIENIYVDRKSFDSESDYNLYLIDLLKERNIDLVVLAGYLRVLSADFIKEFKNRIINIHPSLIPSFCGKGYYGENVHRSALEYGVKVSGATVHFVDEGTDTGPIILQETVKVNPSDKVEDLQKRVLKLEHKLLVEAVKLFCEDRIEVNGRIVNIL